MMSVAVMGIVKGGPEGRVLLPADDRRELVGRAVQGGSVGNGNGRGSHLGGFGDGKRVGFRVTVRGGNHGVRVLRQW